MDTRYNRGTRRNRGQLDGFSYPLAGNIIINTPLESSLTPVTGPTPTFTRSLVRNYANSPSTLAQVATTVPAFGATLFGSTSSLVSGLELTGETVNLLLRSEDFTAAEWTAIGTGAASSNTATDPFGTTLGDTISGSATGDGIEQITGYVTTNTGAPVTPTKAYLFSVFLKCSTGTQLVYLQMRDTLDATLTVKQECRLTTTWQRFECYGQFLTTSTGFLACGIVVGNSNTCRAFGAQMQQAGNTGGSNMRARSCAGPYVTTAGTTKFSNTEVLTYPSATMDGARAAGTISFWVKPGRVYNQILEGNVISYLSIGGEALSVYDSSDSVVHWMGNPVYGSTFGLGFRKGVWNHIAISWNDATNSRTIVVNGQTHYDGTAAFTTWTAGLNLYLGQHSGTAQYWSAFATYRNFVVWNTQLSATQMKSIYNGERLDYLETYGTGLLFEVDLGVSTAPTTFQNQVVQYDGTLVPITFAHTGNILAQQPYFSDATTYAGLAPYSNPALPAAPPLNTATNKGMQLSPNNKNFILQSCAPGTTWTPIGAPTITNAVGNAFGANMPYGTIDGVSGEGIEQAISLATASNAFVASAWVRVAAGTLAGNITVEGSSGGTPQSTSTAFTATTDWQQVHVYKSFTGAATGNCNMELTLAGTGVLQVSGMMLERRLGGQFSNVSAPCAFIKTTTSTVEVLPGFLWYNAMGNFNPYEGTMVAWAWLDMDSTDIINSDGCTVFGMDGGQNNYAFQLHYVGDNLNFSYGASQSTEIATYATPGVQKHVWYQYGVTWSTTTAGVTTITLWLDGVQVATETHSNGIIPGWGRMCIGNCKSSLLAADGWKGGFGQIRSWGSADGSLISADWNSNKTDYGR